MVPDTRAEIDLSAIRHNLKALMQATSPSARFMAVVKADAYGHGAAKVAAAALDAGADALGVARVDEGVQLRDAGITAPILIFGFTSPEWVERMIAQKLTPTVFDLQTAEAYNRRAGAVGMPLGVHVKIDTGMGRLGFPVMDDPHRSVNEWPSLKETAAAIRTIHRHPHLTIDGIFTHFASADHRDKSDASGQAGRFKELLNALETLGINIPVKHAANSAAIIELPETHLDMVRAGIAIYGLYPSDQVDRARVALRPAMTLKTRVAQVKSVPAGFRVSYGGTHVTPRPTVIATVPVGYADGFSRGLSSRGHMLVNGQRAPIVGRVCMDLTMLDVGGIGRVRPGDDVVVFGGQIEHAVTADEIAALLGTINYEVVATITARVPRIYLS